jgi:two-component system, LytTR family, sensor kinase
MHKVLKVFSGPIVYHLLVLMLLLVPHAIYTTYIARKDLTLYFLNILVIDGLLVSIIYINLYYLIPRFHTQKQYAAYFLLLALLVVIFIFGAWQMNRAIQEAMDFPDEPIIYFVVSTTVYIVQYLLISFFLFNLKERIDQKKRMDEIQLEKLKTEINYLRAQINPHFLFNTLNNLYGLALEKSNKTPEIIMRLSRMMDYMLYESEDAMVYLKKDIENIQNYIEIERIRQGNNAVINFQVLGDMSSQKIVPLLLLPLIENGFKHGINKQINDAFLDIAIAVHLRSVELKVTNNYKNVDASDENQRSGIGLNNLNRRLELFYPGKYELSTARVDSRFEAFLKVDLS